MEKIYVLGVGPGSPDYLPPVTGSIAAECDLLIGGRRNLALFEGSSREKIEINGKLDEIFDLIRTRRQRGERIAILLSGDTGIYSLLPRLAKEFGRQGLAVYPGISAVQYLFARLGLCWHDACTVSLHGREPDDLLELATTSAKLVVFTDPKNTPAELCRYLTEAGLGNRKIYIGENLSYPEEKICQGRVKDFTGYSASELNLVLIAPEETDE